MSRPKANSLIEVLLEAEVRPDSQPAFEKRYFEATGQRVSPGRPPHYQSQKNKWGAELRVYFNDDDLKAQLDDKQINVESDRTGYKSGDYKYRVSNNEYWWLLVERDGKRLGSN